MLRHQDMSKSLSVTAKLQKKIDNNFNRVGKQKILEEEKELDKLRFCTMYSSKSCASWNLM
jgi:hypothetical protein